VTRLHATLALLALGAAMAGPAAAQQNPHGKLPEGVDCADCHTPKSWKVDLATAKFDHDTQTGFPLTGRHRSTACRSCHLDLSFDEPSLRAAECATCHADVHRGAYTGRCAECHNTVSFADLQARQVHARTIFPLTGAHLQVECRACHVDDRLGAFTPLDPQCVACHRTAYEQAQPVDHVASGFPLECQRCHSTIAWSAYVRFDHPTVSGGFRLLGAHERIRCLSCHDAQFGPRFQPANDQDCIACHEPDYQRAHPGGGFPTTCTNCHTVETWTGATFDHALVANGFRLLGAHARLDCSSCHATDMTPLFHPANDQDCVTCHQADFDREHPDGRFPTTCLQCHTVDTWSGATFVHSPSMTDCVTCHHDDFLAATSPVNHVAQGIIESACAQCHSNSGTSPSWEPTRYTHGDCYNSATNRAHQGARCEQCHASAYPAATCTACHRNRSSCRD
jgi:hypothetical protein